MSGLFWVFVGTFQRTGHACRALSLSRKEDTIFFCLVVLGKIIILVN